MNGPGLSEDNAHKTFSVSDAHKASALDIKRVSGWHSFFAEGNVLEITCGEHCK